MNNNQNHMFSCIQSEPNGQTLTKEGHTPDLQADKYSGWTMDELFSEFILPDLLQVDADSRCR